MIYKFINESNPNSDNGQELQVIEYYSRTMKSFSIIYNNYSNKFDIINDCFITSKGKGKGKYYLANNTNMIESFFFFYYF